MVSEKPDTKIFCNFCLSYKDIGEMQKNKSIKRGCNLCCKVCANKKQAAKREELDNNYTKHYEKSRKGFLVRTYRNMLSRVKGIQPKSRNLYVGLDILDKGLFYTWALADIKYKELHEDWVKSGYERKITPSIDRIDSKLGYTPNNIRWLTLSENSSLGANSNKEGIQDEQRTKNSTDKS